MESLPIIEASLSSALKAANRFSARIFSAGGLSEFQIRGQGHAEMAVGDLCHGNCSGRGECLDGACYCQIQFEGSECKTINYSYHVAFASIFFLLSLTSLVQLVMCIHAEYLRMKKNPSLLRACRVTTQKLLYFLVFLASLIRGAYFATPTLRAEWSVSLFSAYYPLLLTGSSLIVCFWAEIFHLRQIRWDRPRFLSKSFLGFVTFNVISYTLLIVELVLVWVDHDDREFWTHVFNGIYAALMCIVVIFFLYYGVEVFFKVNGGFRYPMVAGTIASQRRGGEHHRRPIIKRQLSRSLVTSDSLELETKDEVTQPLTSNPTTPSKKVEFAVPKSQEAEESLLQDELNAKRMAFGRTESEEQIINTSQLHQSRLGLLSQALMMMVIIGFLFLEVYETVWSTHFDLTSRNTHDIIFRTVEIGVALWFPCVLWNCIRPEQLWCLNPKKIIESFPPLSDVREAKSKRRARSDLRENDEVNVDSSDEDDEDKGPECWICYDSDRTDAGAMINPCLCKGDVGAVHHDCLRRWLVESADNPESLRCKVCNSEYLVERGSQFSLAQGFTLKHWLLTLSIVTLMGGSICGCWFVVQMYTQPWARMVAVGSALLVQYICLRSLGLNTLTAYQRAKVSALNIVNLNRKRKHFGTNTADDDLDDGQGQGQINSISESVNEGRSARGEGRNLSQSRI